MSSRDRLLAAAAPALLAAVALLQFVIAHTRELSPWKGGGFGMFSTVDSPGLRFIRISLITPRGAVPVALPKSLSKLARELRTSPDRVRLERLAVLLARGRSVPIELASPADRYARLAGPAAGPSPLDGGVESADRIARLLRYTEVPETASNFADAAVALPLKPDMISNPPLDGVPAPSPTSRCVALGFAGHNDPTKGTISLGHPIQTVLTFLAVNFSEHGSVVSATIGMTVQKAGRTSGRTTGRVELVHYAASVQGPRSIAYTFIEQIAFTDMLEPGDSGSLIIEDP